MTSVGRGDAAPAARGASATSALRSVVAGVLLGLLTVAHAVAIASLVFKGPLEPWRGAAIAAVLLATAVVGLVIGASGAVRGGTGLVQDAPAAVLAVVVAGVVAGVPIETQPEAVYATAVAAIALLGLATGGVLLALGAFRVGSLVRYLPYPVVGGFTAGTGWLLVVGGVAATSGLGIGELTPSLLSAPELVVRWAPALAFGCALLALTRLVGHPLVFPVGLIAAAACFHAGLAVTRSDPAAVRAAGHLLGPFGEGIALQLPTAASLASVHWPTVASHALPGGAVVLVAVLGVLFNATSVEVAIRTRIDLDRQLRVSGIANLLAGGIGGGIGYQGLGFTLLNHRVGVGSRASALLATAVVALVLLRGPALLEGVPTFVVGGVLTFLGGGMILRWLVESVPELPRREYAVIVTIAATVVVAGFLPGVGVGLVLAVVLFVVSYARTDPVRHTRSGGAVLGSVRRGATERRVLAEGHRATLVLELQGYLFFGSMHRVTERIEERLATPPALARLVLDFRHVSGIDATATAALANVARTLGAHGVALTLSAVPSAARARVARALAAAGSAGAVAFAASLADATDGCDAEVLGGALAAPDAVGAALDRLEQLVGDDLEPMDLLPHLERVRLPPGATVLAAGAVPDALWLVAAGRLGATGTRTPDGGPTERLSPGALVGASELLSGRPAEASMVALEATTLYRLGREALARIDAHDPALAGAVHAAVARQLADELDHLRAFTASVEDRGPTTVSSATVPARGPG